MPTPRSAASWSARGLARAAPGHARRPSAAVRMNATPAARARRADGRSARPRRADLRTAPAQWRGDTFQSMLSTATATWSRRRRRGEAGCRARRPMPGLGFSDHHARADVWLEPGLPSTPPRAAPATTLGRRPSRARTGRRTRHGHARRRPAGSMVDDLLPAPRPSRDEPAGSDRCAILPYRAHNQLISARGQGGSSTLARRRPSAFRRRPTPTARPYGHGRRGVRVRRTALGLRRRAEPEGTVLKAAADPRAACRAMRWGGEPASRAVPAAGPS